ncbi:hypothetical protein [Pseudomonas cichorii]|uniref:hypothetical protein n=1 Tax=Pseudomonas cichorii TaxID=36746 RepID=UPI001C8AEA2E|nr:hypothetical protein [Pseudomonas cichorii]
MIKRLELPEHAVMSVAWFWGTNALNRLADKQDFIGITKCINGGTNGFAERDAFYGGSALNVLA